MVSGGGGENAFQVFYVSICTPGSGLTRKEGRPQMAGCLKRHRLPAPSDTLQRPKPINVRTAASWSLKAWSLPAISSGPLEVLERYVYDGERRPYLPWASGMASGRGRVDILTNPSHLSTLYLSLPFHLGFSCRAGFRGGKPKTSAPCGQWLCPPSGAVCAEMRGRKHGDRRAQILFVIP